MLLALLIAFCGSLIFIYLHLPLPWLLGSIFATSILIRFQKIPIQSPKLFSAPARILIDFLDPLVVAEKVALTEKYKFITIDDIAYELRDGKNGISGIGAKGKMIKQ